MKSLLAALLLGCVAALHAEPITLFAFDDHSLPYRLNLKLTFNRPEKHPGNPVVAPGPPGSPDAVRAQFYGSVIREGGKYRMWYCAIAGTDTVGNASTSARLAYAESDDGLRWTKPDLGLTEFNGSKRNNLLGMPAGLHLGRIEPLVCFVLHEPDDPDPARRYKMAAYGRYYPSPAAPRYPGVPADNVPSTIYPFFSADGLTWMLALPLPKAGGAFDETEAPIRVRNNFEIGGLYKFDGLYHVTGQALSPDVFAPDGSIVRRTMDTHWSADFINWSQDKSLAFQRWGYRGPRESLQEAHEPAGVWHRGNVLLGLYGLWHGAVITIERRMDLGFLVSNDGVHFREPVADQVFIPAGPDGAWDQRGLIHGQGFENVGDRTFLYYGNWDLSGAKREGAIGLAFLPRDRFASLSPRDPGDAQFTTMPLANTGPRMLRLNLDGVSATAALRVELIDERGAPIPGYSGADAAVVRQPGFAVTVRWAGRERIEFNGRACRLRVSFDGPDAARVRFYAAYLE